MDAMNKKTLHRLLISAKSIAITTHIESDADGMVAAFALQKILERKGLDSLIITDGESLAAYDFLMVEPRVKAHEHGLVYDTVFVLDCNSTDRLGDRAELLKTAKQILVLDHHIQEPHGIKADFSIIESSYVSAGAIIYELFQDEISSMEAADRLFVANCVYVTILNDTNNFINDNTEPRVFQLAGELVAMGVKPFLMYRGLMLNNSAAEMRYIGGTLATIELVLDSQLLFMHSSFGLKTECGVNPEDFKQATRYVQGVRDIAGLVYFREDAPGKWKLSLRALNIDVQKIAAKYGGGGHKQASGCSFTGSLSEIKARLKKDFEEALQNG